jgi:hypothetical protein
VTGGRSLSQATDSTTPSLSKVTARARLTSSCGRARLNSKLFGAATGYSYMRRRVRKRRVHACPAGMRTQTQTQAPGTGTDGEQREAKGGRGKQREAEGGRGGQKGAEAHLEFDEVFDGAPTVDVCVALEARPGLVRLKLMMVYENHGARQIIPRLADPLNGSSGIPPRPPLQDCAIFDIFGMRLG